MTIYNKKEGATLFLGDIFFFIAALWLSLAVRYLEIPSQETFFTHLMPFSILFTLWLVSFFIAGLYGKHTLLFKSRLPTLILHTQIINSILAVFFFYLLPYFDIAPKMILFLYLIFSFVLVLAWRTRLVATFGFRKKQKAILIGEGSEMRELYAEVNHNPRYGLFFVSSIDLDKLDGLDFEEDFLRTVYEDDVSSIVIDLKNKKIEPFLSRLYNLIFHQVHFIDMHNVYEDIFDRVPLSILRYSWFLENISAKSHLVYDIMKRAMDIGISVPIGILSLVFYPFVYVAMKFDDGGKIFIRQDRIGKGGGHVKIYKFRTMSPGQNEEQEVTRVGNILRKTRIDELPQLWNVIRGDLSLIGPRPELPHFVKLYQKEIPYYNIRHLLTPGLSGWAQIHMDKPPKFKVGYDETKTKLSYDLYYIKNRSFMLDIKIALLTIRTLLSRSGI
jgi:lipopolysaccharide/colanic/teichoic acid biosynthesis glycosyltransferase